MREGGGTQCGRCGGVGFACRLRSLAQGAGVMASADLLSFQQILCPPESGVRPHALQSDFVARCCGLKGWRLLIRLSMSCGRALSAKLRSRGQRRFGDRLSLDVGDLVTRVWTGPRGDAGDAISLILVRTSTARAKAAILARTPKRLRRQILGTVFSVNSSSASDIGGLWPRGSPVWKKRLASGSACLFIYPRPFRALSRLKTPRNTPSVFIQTGSQTNA